MKRGYWFGGLFGFLALVAFALPPLVVEPSSEIRLQAAIAEETINQVDPPTLNGLLRSIDIRTALEDTERIRSSLG